MITLKKYALITGASGGIGQALPSQLAKRVIRFIYIIIKMGMRFENYLQSLAAFNGEYIPIQADLSTRDGYKKIAENIFSIDTIVHNSGISHYGLFVDIDEEIVEEMTMVHITSPLTVNKRASCLK